MEETAIMSNDLQASQTKQPKKMRESNFELLRILSILMIIGFHYYLHGAGVGNSIFSKVFYYSDIFNGNIGVAIFLLISGWFLCSSKFSWSKLFMFCGEIIFYSYMSMAIVALVDSSLLSFTDVIRGMFPISSEMNWYAANYVVAYAFTPFIKKACEFFHSESKLYNYFLILCLVFFVGFGFITPKNEIIKNLVWMIFMFFVGDYLRWRKEGKSTGGGYICQQ